MARKSKQEENRIDFMDYFEIGRKRVEEHQKQLKIFV